MYLIGYIDLRGLTLYDVINLQRLKLPLPFCSSPIILGSNLQIKKIVSSLIKKKYHGFTIVLLQW